MAQGILTANSSTPWFIAEQSDGVHIGLSGSFGGGSVAVEKRVNGAAVPLLDEGTAITHTVADDSIYNLLKGDKFRLTLSGATTPVLDFAVTGFVRQVA